MSKVIKIPLIVLAIVLGLALILLGIAQTSWFKNYLADRATQYLSEELGTHVEIDEVSLAYFDRLNATRVFMEDQKGDTMFFIHELEVNYDLIGIINGTVLLDDILLDNAIVNLGIHEGESSLNLQYLIDYFTPKNSTGAKSTQTTTFSSIELINSSFHYFDRNANSPTSRDFNETDFMFSGINGIVNDLVVINDSISFEIENLAATEKSGLQINKLKTVAIISPTIFSFNELLIETPQSRIQKSIIFKQNSFNDFADFITKVDMELDFDESEIHSKDLAYFSNELKSYTEVFTVSGKLSGKVNSLFSDALSANISNHTQFNGKTRVVGLPNIDRMVINATIQRLNTSTSAIKRLSQSTDLPPEFLNLGTLGFVGKFDGTLTDFVVNGDLSTSQGDVKTNLHLIHPESMDAEYVGSVSSTNINLGQIINVAYLGSTGFDLFFEGRGFDLEHLNSEVKGSIGFVEYNQYNYQNSTINGFVKDGSFNGKFVMNDANFKFGFEGAVDANNETYNADISANVQSINLKTLGLDTLESILTMVGRIDVNGSDLDNLVGTLLLDSIQLARGKKNYNLKNVTVKSSKELQRKLTLKSDIADVAIIGDYRPSEFQTIAEHILYVLDPLQYPEPTDSLISKTFSFSLYVDTMNKLIADVVPGLAFDSVRIKLDYLAQIGKVNGHTHLANFTYEGLGSPSIDLTFGNASLNTPINYNLKTAGLYNQDSVVFENLDLHGFIRDGLINFETLANKDSTIGIELIGHATYGSDSLKLYLDNSRIEIFKEEWTLRDDESARLVYHDGVTEVTQIDLRNGDQILFFQGSTGKVTKMNLNMIDFSLANINPFISAYGISVAGLTNGSIDVSDRDGYPIIESHDEGIIIQNLKLDDDTLGDFTLKSYPSEDLLKVQIAGQVKNGLLNDMTLDGSIDFNDEKSPLDLHFRTNKSGVKPLEKVFVGLFSDVSGTSTADIRISGPLTKPVLAGEIELEDVGFVLDYVKTRYTANATIDIDANAFTIRSAKLLDRFGSVANVTGNVKHRNFLDFNFNIGINQLKNFEIMNTTRKDNDLFYGTAFVDGEMKVLGPIDDIMLQIDAKSRPKTNISIPLDYFEASGNLSYVTFVNLDKDPNSIGDNFTAAAGVRMDFNLEITNDAKIVLVFDELLGDKIEARTHGSLRLEVNTYGDFNMYGGLTVDNGNYLFTAYDIISKYFEVEPGGTIFWDGNPYNATLNLDAVKREYPYPTALVAGTSTSEDYSDPLPTDVHLLLKGLLFNPEVTFDLTFPGQTALSSGNSTLSTVIDRIKADQEEIDRQVFALLALGTFIPPSFSGAENYDGSSVASTGWNSISDFASSQLNNMISQFDLPFQVGVDWQKNAEDLGRDELVTTLKYKIKRWEFSGSVDALAQSAESTPYDITIEYKLNEEGNLKMKGFVKNANDPTIGNFQTTTGIGLNYRYQFNRFFDKRRKKNK